jgi:hypothetical protein
MSEVATFLSLEADGIGDLCRVGLRPRSDRYPRAQHQP